MSRTYNRRSEIRRLVRERAAGMCELCGTVLDPSAPLTDAASPSMHHRYPRRSQGRDCVWNLLLLCRDCHCFGIHQDEQKARELGRLCDHRDNEKCAVLTREGWVRLLGDGTYAALHQVEIDPRECHRRPGRRRAA